ncbi:MAG: glycosyltransferase [Deferrisomatales bacterium]
MTLVSVLLPAFNAAEFLSASVESVLSQTYPHIELIVVDDGSTDATAEIASRYAAKDRRVTVVRNEENRGVTCALNRALSRAAGELVARQDADDLSRPERLARQVAYLRRHPGVAVVGTWAEYMNPEGRPTGVWRTPAEPGAVAWALLFGTALAHPSVLMRRTALEACGGYDESIRFAQDYDLWCRLLPAGQLANLPEVLYRRRVHGEAIGARYKREQDEVVLRIMARRWRELLGREVAREELRWAFTAVRGEVLGHPGQLRHVLRLIDELACAPADRDGAGGTHRRALRRQYRRTLRAVALRHRRVAPRTAAAAWARSWLRRLP